ncbi:porin [Caballeronia sp. dw_276]|uniref:porin n=1 Tax=Caballeronia sp. dw_276 TaxID=2719795 RepID=UPI001BD592CE|nr:porin [Caballeronia sp. dw_276]
MTHFSRSLYSRNRMFKPAAATAAVIATATLPHAAHAQVTLYGAVDSGITWVNNVRTTANAAGNFTGGSVARMANGVVWGSRFGFKGTEDLGGGNQAIFTLENGFTPSNGALGNNGRLFGRQAFAGLSNSKYGTVTLGRQYDSANEYVGNMIYGMGSSFVHVGDLDHLDTIARVDNAIKYTSPLLSGFRFGGLYSFGGTAGTMSSGSTWSVGGSYAQGPLALAASYVDMRRSVTADPATWTATADSVFNSSVNEGYASAASAKFAALAAQYQIGGLRAGLTYTNTRYIAGSNSLFDGSAVFDNYTTYLKYLVTPATQLFAEYGYTARHDVSTSKGEAGTAHYNQYVTGINYSLSKRTGVYAQAVYVRASGNAVNARGQIVAATGVAGDLTLGASAATAGQFAGTLGLYHLF